MRNWYEAISEDLEIDLKKLSKHYDYVSIHPKSLSKYKESGNTPKKEPAINGILALIQTQYPEFDKPTLLDYFAGKHQEAPNDLIKQSCINNIAKALKSVLAEGISLDVSPHTLPKKPNKLAEWIYRTIPLPDGLDSIGQLLEAIRRELNTIKQYEKVRELHDAIAPLVITGANCADSARNQISSLNSVNRLSAPAIGGLSILRSQGQALSLKIEEKKGRNHFSDPENAVVEKIFSAEDGSIEKRLVFRLLKKSRLLPDNAPYEQFEITDDDIDELTMTGERYAKSLQQPYIYFENDEDYPKDQLKAITDKFKGFYTFADYADNTIDVFNDGFALTWLRLVYGDLESIRKGLEEMQKIRIMIASLSSSGSNEELQLLHNSGSSINNTDYLERLEQLTAIASQSSETLANIPKAIESATTLYEKASAILSALPETIAVLGGS